MQYGRQQQHNVQASSKHAQCVFVVLRWRTLVLMRERHCGQVNSVDCGPTGGLKFGTGADAGQADAACGACVMVTNGFCVAEYGGASPDSM